MRVGVLIAAAVLAACSSDETSKGSGGAGGTSATTSTTTGPGAGGAGQGGAGGSPACASPTDCGSDDTCVTHTCDGGTCGSIQAAKGTPCTESDGNVCSEGACVAWAPLSTVDAPVARSKHTMTWTGSRMIVWGGRTGPGEETNSGHAYDPATDGWTAISTSGAPSVRHSHTALWTGTELVVWGGFGGGSALADGGAYDPATDTWRTLAAAPLSGCTDHVMLWTGTEILIWGGRDGATLYNQGGRYNPATDSWGSIAPFPLGGRFNVFNAWMPITTNVPNGALLIWGGSNLFDWFGDGAYWDPVLNSWTLVASTPGGPPNGGAVPGHFLEGGTTVRFANIIYLWGGWDGGNHYNNGYVLDLTLQSGGYWYNVPVTASTLSARRFHVSVPSTKAFAFFAWGGCSDSSCSSVLGDGGYFINGSGLPDPWQYIPEDPALTPRSDTAAINTGDEVVIWGGLSTQNMPLGDGARRLMPDPPP